MSGNDGEVCPCGSDPTLGSVLILGHLALPLLYNVKQVPHIPLLDDVLAGFIVLQLHHLWTTIGIMMLMMMMSHMMCTIITIMMIIMISYLD